MVDLDPETLAAQSDAVVIGTVQSVESRWDAGGGNIETVVQFRINETVAGAEAGETITIVAAGGTVGEITQWVEDEPVFFPGQTAGLFLTRAPDATYRVTGLAQGQYILDDAAVQKSAAAGITDAEFREFVTGGVSGLSNEESDAPVGGLSITPATASAGTGTAITITGSGFGTKASRGSNADVAFYFTTDGQYDYYMLASGYAYDGSSWYEVYENHIVSWSDSQIVVQVPAGPAWRGSWYRGSASSGPVYVLTDDGREIGPYSLSVPFGWFRSKWAGTHPTVAYYVNPGSVTGALSAVQNAANTWSVVPNKDFIFSYAGPTSATGTSSNSMNEIIWGYIDTPGVVAQASTWSSGGIVSETDIKFNTYYSWSTTPGSSQMDIESVCLHELGHWVQLSDLYGNINGYPSDTGKVMYGRIGSGQVKRVLTTGDISGIRYIYPDSSPVAPTVTGIAPASGYDNSSSQTVTITGSGFTTGASVSLTRPGESPVGATAVTVHSPSTITCTFDLAGVPAGAWNVAVTSTGGLSGTLAGGFTVLPSVVVPAAEFSANATAGTAPLTVRFTDTSANSPTSWGWDFGDGATSTLRNPVHTYAAAGVYTVQLTASNAGGSDTATESNFISVREPTPPVANFTANRTSGMMPLAVAFTDTSTNDPEAWAWSFGDGATSTEASPVHTYAAAGTYPVTLTVTNADGSDTVTREGYISVTAPAAPTANFTANVTSGPAPLTVQFTDTSAGSPTAWSWTFGDGAASTEQNPVHTYAAAGNYTVTLTVSNAIGSDTLARSGYITAAVPGVFVTAAAAAPAVIPTDTDGTPGTGENTTLSVTVTGESPITAVTANLSAIGGSAAAAMADAGNGTWTLSTNATAPSPFAGGAYQPVLLSVNATAAGGGSNTSVSIPLTVVQNGDANEDYKVTLYDAVYTARHVLGADGYPMTGSIGMVSGGEGLSLHDAMYLARYVLGVPGYETLH